MSWPTVAEFKVIVDLDPNATTFDTMLEVQLNAGIALVKDQTGAWDEDVDEPDDNLSGAALRAAFLLSLKESPASIVMDQVFMTFMLGRRRGFSIA